MEYLERIMVVMDVEGQDNRDRILHRGLPLKFNTAQFQPSQDVIRMAWTSLVKKYPEMKSLRNVKLEFVVPEREHPPYLLSVKLEKLHREARR